MVDSLINKSGINQVGKLSQDNNHIGNRNAAAAAQRSPYTIIPTLTQAYDEKTLKQVGIIECATCASRTYMDGSDDPGVSFKSPTHVSPEASHSAVRSHEQEHVAGEQADALQDGGEVISQSVSIYMSTCPECGKSYTAGGTTKTTVRYGSTQTGESYKGHMLDVRL